MHHWPGLAQRVDDGVSYRGFQDCAMSLKGHEQMVNCCAQALRDGLKLVVRIREISCCLWQIDSWVAKPSGKNADGSRGGNRYLLHRQAQLIGGLGYSNDIRVRPCAMPVCLILTARMTQLPFHQAGPTVAAYMRPDAAMDMVKYESDNGIVQIWRETLPASLIITLSMCIFWP